MSIFEKGEEMNGGAIMGTGICESCHWRKETVLTEVCEQSIMRKSLILRAMELEKKTMETAKPLTIPWAFEIAMLELTECSFWQSKSWWKRIITKRRKVA